MRKESRRIEVLVRSISLDYEEIDGSFATAAKLNAWYVPRNAWLSSPLDSFQPPKIDQWV